MSSHFHMLKFMRNSTLTCWNFRNNSRILWNARMRSPWGAVWEKEVTKPSCQLFHQERTLKHRSQSSQEPEGTPGIISPPPCFYKWEAKGKERDAFIRFSKKPAPTRIFTCYLLYLILILIFIKTPWNKENHLNFRDEKWRWILFLRESHSDFQTRSFPSHYTALKRLLRLSFLIWWRRSHKMRYMRILWNWQEHFGVKKRGTSIYGHLLWITTVYRHISLPQLQEVGLDPYKRIINYMQHFLTLFHSSLPHSSAFDSTI